MINEEMEKIELKSGQKKAYDIMVSGKNCYISGDAGTGKSKLIEKYVYDMKNKGKNIIVCAPTGIAADNINGITFHHAFGYPAKVLSVNDQRIKVSNNITNADIIIVDEVSMLRIDAFEVFASQVQLVLNRRKAQKESGIKLDHDNLQIIMLGDFFQLQPVVVSDKGEKEALKQLYPRFNVGYAFESKYWDLMDFEYINLDEVIRQKDVVFSTALKHLKNGEMKILDWLSLNIKNNWDGVTTVLCGTNKEVEKINNEHLSLLSGPTYTYDEVVTKYSDVEITEGDRRNDKKVILKVGARVMSLINNKDDNFFNGSRGIVTQVDNDGVWVHFEGNAAPVKVQRYTWDVNTYKTDKVVEPVIIGTINQIPIRLAYAITVHKAQGQTFDKIAIKPDKLFAFGHHYVAFSRCKTLEGIQLVERPIPKVITFDSGYTRKVVLTSEEVFNFAKKHHII